MRHGFSDRSKLTYSTGLEMVFANQFFARGGMSYDDEINKRTYSMGAGWRAPKIAFNYAYKRDAYNSNEEQHFNLSAFCDI